jgi:hypothetical protein
VHGSACFLMRRLGPHPKCIYFCFCITNADKQACVFRARNGSLNVACMSPRGTCWVRLGEAGAGDELLQGWGRTASPELHLQDGLREGTAGHQANSCIGEKHGGDHRLREGPCRETRGHCISSLNPLCWIWQGATASLFQGCLLRFFPLLA